MHGVLDSVRLTTRRLSGESLQLCWLSWIAGAFVIEAVHSAVLLIDDWLLLFCCDSFCGEDNKFHDCLKLNLTFTDIRAGVWFRFAVHSSDVDLSYGPKDVWESYLAYIDAAGTDGAIHLEMGKSPINTGNFVMLPTEGGKSFMRSWIAQTNHHIDAGGNQTPLKDLQSEEAYYLCELLDECGTKRKGINSSRRKAALLRTFRPPWWKAGSNDVCRLSGDPPPPKVDPCHPMLMYVHPVCTKNRAGKLDVIKQMGFWFMVEDERYTNRTYAGCPIDATVATMVPRCTPREDAGRGFETCQTRLAFSGQLW